MGDVRSPVLDAFLLIPAAACFQLAHTLHPLQVCLHAHPPADQLLLTPACPTPLAVCSLPRRPHLG